MVEGKMNMYEIKIEVHPVFWNSWERDKKDDEIPHLINRVAAICCGHPDPHRQEQGYEWALDYSNNWKAERSSEDSNILIVAYRYGDGNADFMQILQTFLQCSHVVGEKK